MYKKRKEADNLFMTLVIAGILAVLSYSAVV